jgi:hypothetical protein
MFYLGVLEQLLCMCLPYGFVGLWPVAVLDVSVWGGSLFYGGLPSQ